MKKKKKCRLRVGVLKKMHPGGEGGPLSRKSHHHEFTQDAPTHVKIDDGGSAEARKKSGALKMMPSATMSDPAPRPSCASRIEVVVKKPPKTDAIEGEVRARGRKIRVSRVQRERTTEDKLKTIPDYPRLRPRAQLRKSHHHEFTQDAPTHVKIDDGGSAEARKKSGALKMMPSATMSDPEPPTAAPQDPTAEDASKPP
jgi:hypothetical protein